MGRQKVLITDVVLVETIWTLKGRKYRLTKTELMAVIEQLFQDSNVVFEDSQTVWDALHDYSTAAQGNDVDFADTLILEKAKFDAGVKAETFEGLFTFDADLQQLNQVKKL
jgi:predicted nucleic-acid-binding protein